MVIPKQSVFLFVGNDKYLKEEALKKLISSLPGSARDLSDLITFYGGELDHQEVIDSLNTVPLLSDNRIIIIRDIDKISDELKASLIEYIKRPSRTAYLVLDSQDDSAIEDYAEASGHINIRQFGSPTGNSLASWIKDYLKSKGKSIEDDAVDILKELEGNDLSYLSLELDKLIAFSGDRKNIASQDVEEIIGKSLIKSVFDMADEIGRKNTAGAINIASSLISAGKKEYELIGILSWFLKRMLKARMMKDAGENNYSIASIVRVGRKFQDDFFRQLASFKQDKIRAGIEVLLQADLDIKRSRFDSGSILELTIIRLCLL